MLFLISISVVDRFEKSSLVTKKNEKFKKMNYIPFTLICFLSVFTLNAQKSKNIEIKSPDASISLHIEAGTKFQWSVQHKEQHIIEPSPISIQLEDGEKLGDNASIISLHKEEINTEIYAVNYTKTIIENQYNQLTINCKGNYGVIFRVYNDAVAYRFFAKRKGEMIIKNEEANFNFTSDLKAFIPYMPGYRDDKLLNYSFESRYTEHRISNFKKDSLAFLPLLVDVENGKKVVILEGDLEEYPGMLLNINQTANGFKGVYAPYPLEEEPHGEDCIPTESAKYIAITSGTRYFPWRVIVISEHDKELLNNDIIQKLASPPRIKDLSWIEPGQVAWDWWNGLNVSHVNFKAGYNTSTYNYFIDFAAANKIKYIIMDGGWSGSDLTKVSPGIDLQKIVDYGKQKGVGVILWATWYTIRQQMDVVFPLYSKMGIKGFKIDYIDRADQKAIASTYEIAKKAADNHLLVDYHGVSKPSGLQRTYPNVIGYEGVKGLENYKWDSDDNVPRYDVSIPFIRMMAGPMDYTPGAMRNTNKANFRAIFSNPMSQGTRCHQLAMYVIYVAPLQMLSDNPTTYQQEQESTDFISKVPTTFEKTVPLDGKVGEYLAIARKKGDVWYVGALTNWDARDLILDFSFLDKGTYEAIIFKDGINADREATDYERKVINISSGDKLNIQLSNGGGWAAIIKKIK